jgi:hypothetical protein
VPLKAKCLLSACEETVVNASAAVSVDRALHLAFLVSIRLQFSCHRSRTKLNYHPSQHHHGNGSDKFSKRLQVIFTVQRHGTFVVAYDP